MRIPEVCNSAYKGVCITNDVPYVLSFTLMAASKCLSLLLFIGGSLLLSTNLLKILFNCLKDSEIP